jgi:catalase
VAILALAEGEGMLVREPATKDFVSDAFAHAKFIAYCLYRNRKAATRQGRDSPRRTLMAIKAPQDAPAFLQNCGQLRSWQRAAKLHVLELQHHP